MYSGEGMLLYQLTSGQEMFLFANTHVGVHTCTGHTRQHYQQPLTSYG